MGVDVRTALAYVRRHARALGVDKNRICIASFSNGVPTGLAVAVRDRSIKCALIFLRRAGAGTASTRLTADFAAKAGLDSDFINDAVDALHRRAQEIGPSVQVVTHPRGVHGLDVRNHDARSRAFLRQAVAFARARLE